MIHVEIATAAGALVPSALSQTTKPNIVYIVADDLGWKDVGYHGSDIKTPTIDKLAREGTILGTRIARVRVPILASICARGGRW